MRNIWTYTTSASLAEIVFFRNDRIAAELLVGPLDGSWPGNPALPVGADAPVLGSIGFAVSLYAFYRTTCLGA